MSRSKPTVRLARWSATHPWRAIVTWLLFVAVCFAAGNAAGTRAVRNEGVTGQALTAVNIAHAGGLAEPAVENILIRPLSSSARPGPAVAELTTRMRALPEVRSVATPAMSKGASMVAVTMSGDADTASDRVGPLQSVTRAVAGDYPQLRIEETGGASINSGVNTQLGKDFSRASTLSLPITLLIMLIAFGAIVAAGVPILLALCSVFSAIGLSALASQVVPATGTVTEIILLIGMAVGVDYSLFYLKREREERARGRSSVDAIEIAAATSGHSVLVSGVAVMVSMAGLYLASDATFASLATGSIIVVGVAVLGSLTVLPAVLAKLGRAVDRPRVPLLWRLTNRPERAPRVWPILLRPALRHPAITLGLAVAALGLLATPAAGMKLQASGVDTLPRVIPAVATYHRLTALFPNTETTAQVAVQAAPSSAPAVLSALRRIASTGSSIRASKDGSVHVLEIPMSVATTSPAAARAVHELRDVLVPQALRGIAGAHWAVGGDVAQNLDYNTHMSAALPWVIAFVLVLTLFIMLVTFRSIVIAVTAIAVNLLSALAAFGVLALVFQRTWAEGLLHFTSSGTVTTWIPLFMFVVLFGLSMDYHVFIVSRIREGVASGLPTKVAVEDGIVRSAGVVTSAALVMVSVFAIFASLSLVELKEIGVGLAVAVLVDALVIRIIVLPALMSLLGRANWWPGRLSRRPQAAPSLDRPDLVSAS
jgi:RND superfamily putative drug exporter